MTVTNKLSLLNYLIKLGARLEIKEWHYNVKIDGGYKFDGNTKKIDDYKTNEFKPETDNTACSECGGITNRATMKYSDGKVKCFSIPGKNNYNVSVNYL